jgi:hypothetical protein
MFKTTLRLSALLLIVVVSFYSGRASKYAKSESVFAVNVVPENSQTYFSLSDLSKKPASYRKLEFQLQKTLSVFDPVKGEFISETTPNQEKTSIPNNLDIHYHPDWNEEDNSIYHYDKKIEKSQDAELFNKWCQALFQQKSGKCDHDMRYPLGWNENGYTFCGEILREKRPVQEIFTFLPFGR